MSNLEKQFLKGLDVKLWAAADRLRNNLDAANALANNESAVRELGDEILKKNAIEINDKLRKSTIVDCQVRDSVRAKLKILVRRTLQPYKYPPDNAAEAVELVMKQAEKLSNSWSKA